MSPAGSSVRTGAQGRPVARAPASRSSAMAADVSRERYRDRHQATSKVVPMPMPVTHSGTGS